MLFPCLMSSPRLALCFPGNFFGAVLEITDLEFRAEFCDLTNTPTFAQPNGVLGTSAFGTITSTASGPRVVQFDLKVNY